jgi:hypothetical protein
MKKFLKICGWGALAIALLFALILAIASPIATYIVNNKGEQIVGRQMEADRVIINPYWGGVTIKGFACKELNGETNFVSFDRLYVQIAYPQLMAKRVKIRAIHLDGFNGQVLKSNDRLNFSDIIERFSKKDTVDTAPQDTTPSSWKVFLDDIRINNSAVRYRDVVTNKQWKLEDISLRVPGLFFDNTQTNAGLEFGLPTGGKVGLMAGYRMQSNNYAVNLKLFDVHADVALPLVQDYLNVTGLGALLNGSVHVEGSLDNINNVQLKGNLSMAGMSIRDTHNDEVAAMDELRIVLNKGDLSTNTFILDTLLISGITGDYEVHEGWNTLSRLMKEEEPEDESQMSKTDSTETSGSRDVETSKESKPLVWMAKKVKVTGRYLTYHDYSMKHDWEYEVKDLKVEGNNIANNGRNNVTIEATLTSDAKLKADFFGGLDLATQDTKANVKLTGVQLSDFDAICRNYTGYRLEGGDLKWDGHMDVVNGKMKGTNQIVIDHPRVSKREKLTKAPYRNIPVRTGVKMLTSAQDMIVLDVPVSGDARSPKFNLNKVIGRALLKVFFGPLMGVNDRKTVSEAEMAEMRELLGEEALSDSVSGQTETDVAVTASDSVGLTEVGEE